MKAKILLLLMFTLFSRCSSDKNIMPEGAITGYEYVYSGTMAYPIRFYKVERDSKGVLGLHFSENDEKVTVYKVPEETLDFIDGIVRETKLHKLRTSYRPPVEVLDGYGWYVCISYEKGHIVSGGQNASAPKAQREGIGRINQHLQEIIDSSSEADILSRYERE